MKITRKSELTGNEHTMEIDVTQEQLDRYNEGVELIQTVFPKLSADEREFIMTGITPEEWAKNFPKDEDEDDLSFDDKIIYVDLDEEDDEEDFEN